MSDSTIGNFDEPELPTVIEETKRRFTPLKIVGLVGGLVVIVVVGAIAAFALSSGGGAQPESVLPSDTVAFAKLDLNPSVGQKVDFVRFISRFPSTFKGFNSNDPLDSLIKTANLDANINWSDVKSWIGDRYSVAAVESSNGVVPIVVLAVKDEAAMKYYFAKHDPNLHYALKSGFVLISENQATLNLIASAPKTLADDANYKSDIAALGGGQVALAWADTKRLVQSEQGLISDFASESTLSTINKTLGSASGRLVLGIHFTGNSVAATFLTRGGSASTLTTLAKSQADLSDLPTDTLAGLSIAGIGEEIAKAINQDSATNGLSSNISVSSADIKALLSGPITAIILPSAAKDGTPLIALRLSPTDSAAAVAAAKRLANDGGLLGSLTGQIQVDGANIYLGPDQKSISEVVTRIKAKGNLGETAGYRDAIKSPGFFLTYVNIGKLLPLVGIKGSFTEINSLGIVASVDKSSPGATKSTLAISLK